MKSVYPRVFAFCSSSSGLFQALSRMRHIALQIELCFIDIFFFCMVEYDFFSVLKIPGQFVDIGSELQAAAHGYLEGAQMDFMHRFAQQIRIPHFGNT